MIDVPPAPQPTRPQRPTRAIISTVVIVALAVTVIFGFSTLVTHLTSHNGAPSAGAASNVSSADQGVLLGGSPAPAFTLTDQTGATVTLDSLKGKPTVFTFFDSLCPHTDCSLMAQYVNFTAQFLGSDMNRVNWVALSLNPWHDTTQSVNAFLTNQRLKPHVAYLMGSVGQLQPLWDAFHMQSLEQSNGIVIHTTGIYLLDSQTHEQVFMDEGFDPHTLSGDIELALKKGASAFVGQQGAQTTHSVTQTHTVGDMQVTLTSAPGQYGAYDFTILAQTGTGEAVPNAKVALDLSMTDMKMQPIHVDLQPVLPASTGAYRASGVLSMKGQWIVDVTITPQGASQPSVSAFTFTAF